MCLPSTPSPLRWGWRLPLLAMWLVLGGPCTAAEELPPELRPYRVRLAMTFEEQPQFSAAYRQRFQVELEHLLTRTFGPTWDFQPVAPPPNIAADAASMRVVAQLPPETQLPPDTAWLPDDATTDKLLLIGLSTTPGGYAATACEWDTLTHTFGPVRTESAVTRDMLPIAALRAAVAAFRPIALITDAEATTATLHFRAAGIPTPDPEAAPISVGSLYRAVLRKVDRVDDTGGLREIRPVAWTVLEVTAVGSGELDRGTATVTVQSALRATLAGRRGSVEAWAIATPPTGDATRLTLARRSDGVPLAGRTVELRQTAPDPTTEDQPPLTTLLTDRTGSVRVPADPSMPLVWLTVKSGEVSLLWLPLVPGAEPATTVPMGDDPARLDAEGRLAVLGGELIETVARRATLLAQAKIAARTDDFDTAEAALKQAAKLPDATAFSRRLAAIEVPAAKAAEAAGDRLTAARVHALAKRTSRLIDRYLSADPIRAAREELAELRKVAGPAP